MATLNEPNPQNNDAAGTLESFDGELYRKKVESTGGEGVDPPLLDMPGKSGMLSEEEQKGLLQSGPPPRPKLNQEEPPILSLDFLDLKPEDEKS